MAEDEYSRAKIEEHSKRMDTQDKRIDRQETLTDRIFAALDSMNRWRAKNAVYMVIGSALVSWAAFYLLKHYMDGVLFAGAGAADE